MSSPSARSTSSSSPIHNLGAPATQRFLGGLEYPADKHDVIECAERNEAPQGVLDFLEELPDGQSWNSPAQLSRALSRFG